MELVAYLSEPLLAAVRAVSRSAHSVHAVRSAAELDAALTLRPASAALLDPTAIDRGDVRAVLPILERHASVHVVVYTTVTPESMHGYGVLAAHGARHLILYGVDDGPAQIAALLDALPADTLSTILLRMIDPLLSELPVPLARAIAELFRAPHLVRDNNDVARAAGMSRRAYDRALERAGMAPGDLLVRTARVVRAYHYMRSTRLTVRDIAMKMGYPTPRTLSSEVVLLTGFLPSSLRHELDPEDFLSRVVVRLWRHGCPPGTVVPHAALSAR
jgi:AraC-like DNA-binding protein